MAFAFKLRIAGKKKGLLAKNNFNDDGSVVEFFKCRLITARVQNPYLRRSEIRQTLAGAQRQYGHAQAIGEFLAALLDGDYTQWKRVMSFPITCQSAGQ